MTSSDRDSLVKLVVLTAVIIAGFVAFKSFGLKGIMDMFKPPAAPPAYSTDNGIAIVNGQRYYDPNQYTRQQMMYQQSFLKPGTTATGWDSLNTKGQSATAAAIKLGMTLGGI